MRKLATAALSLLAFAAPSAHAEELVLSYNDGTRGFIEVTLTPDLTARATPGNLEFVNAECLYHHVAGSSVTNTMTIAVVGRVVTGVRVITDRTVPDTTIPVGTVITCHVSSSTGGSASVTGAAPGPAAAAANQVTLPVGKPTICLTADALFSNGQFLRIHDTCAPPDDGVTPGR